jgi:hypothetical protein
MCQTPHSQILSAQPADRLPAISDAAYAAVLGDTGPEPATRLIPARGGRRKLWDIPHKYHCPIIGTCLHVDDLRAIAAKTAARPERPLSDYAIHLSFVAAAADRNTISMATHKALERTYAAHIRRYAKARDADSLRRAWRESLATGDAPGALWALMTHPRADRDILTLAYEDIHMLSHQIGAGQRADLQRLAETRAHLRQLQDEFDLLVSRNRQQADLREARIDALEQSLRQARADAETARERERVLQARLATCPSGQNNARMQDLSTRIAELEEALEHAQTRTVALQSELVAAQSTAEAAEQARHTAEAESRAAEQVLAQALTVRCGDCDAVDCPRRSDLGGRRVLCVGGRKPVVEQYRALVATCNGRFDHHDGGLEDSHGRLEAMLASADLVVCATDYVSHGAYYRTKRFCKRNEKPHALLGRSGLSAFALAIERLAA